MCKEHNHRKLDKCMTHLIEHLNDDTGFKTLSCCCGHGIYPMTIVITDGHEIWELMHFITINRKKKFYKKDKQGYYYIPEVKENEKR